MNIATLLNSHSASPCPAIVDFSHGRRQTLTFAELDRATQRAAARLRTAGVRRGDTILVLVPMCAELYISLAAIFRLGSIAMFLDPSAGLDHIEACCQMNAPRALIGSPRAHALRLVSAALRRIPIKFSTWSALPWLRPLFGARGSEHDEIGVESCPPDATALLRFTSGSTGTPKAAVRTHSFLFEQQRVMQISLGLVAGQVELSSLPLFVLANLAAGVTSLIPQGDLRRPGMIDPEPILRQIRSERPDRVSASPAFLEVLAHSCLERKETLPFKQIFTGGAPVFPHLLDKFQVMSPGAEVVAVYGSTEAEPIACINRDKFTEIDRQSVWSGKGLLVGLPDPVIKVRIIKEGSAESGAVNEYFDFDAATCPVGSAGEIIVSGPHVQPNYLGGVGERETKLRIGGVAWHRTGDSGYFDEEGRLWLLGRSSARIQDSIGILYPFQVECAANRHPQVLRSALVSISGKRVLAVQPRNGSRPANLHADLAWAKLDRIQYLRRIPVDKRHNAKIDYVGLERLLA